MITARKSPLWKAWYRCMKAEPGDFWARFPFMSADELEGELSAPPNLLGRWEVRGKSGSWQEVFFVNKTVFRIDSETPYMIRERGRWSSAHHNLNINWGGGTTEDWPLALSPKRQTVKLHSGGSTTVLTASRIECPNVNKITSFHSSVNPKQSKLIKLN